MWFDLRENRKKKSKQSEDDSTQQGREEGDEIEEEQNEQGIKVHKHVHLFYLLLKRNVLISTCKLHFVKHQTIFFSSWLPVSVSSSLFSWVSVF